MVRGRFDNPSVGECVQTKVNVLVSTMLAEVKERFTEILLRAGRT
jgi:hypothetical protein